MRDARRLKKGSYPVRTRHLKAGEPVYTNRLILEDSPYLLQHAHNPVNWYAWGDEAFAAARKQNKPVFLSIGYSTCHWCHVMEEESFDDEIVADILNKNFISIKVDREQRPDLDEIYMTGVQIMTGSGGWPMSSFLTPDSKPFYGGTYYPKDHFIQLIQRIHEAWIEDPADLNASAEYIYAAIDQHLGTHGSATIIGQPQIDATLAHILAMEDQQYGGQAGAPKFPNETKLFLLLDSIERSDQPLTKNPNWQTLYRALDGMMRGGIYDQLGGGFHRYTTDNQWLRPHFEKMLYNQAQLSRLYARSWKLSGNNEFRRITAETLDYVLREMRTKDGAFYSATDADSEGEEGKYYVWTYQELKQHLNTEQLRLVENVYGVTWEGNLDSANLLYLPRPLHEVASHLKLTNLNLLQQLSVIKHKLLAVRQQRIPPMRDNKIITAWNSLMITALAESGHLLNEPGYIAAANQAAEFIWRHNRDKHGLLNRIHLNGRSSTRATLEDYSFYLQAVLALYDANGDQKWLSRAKKLHQQMTDLFWDKKNGGFYISQARTAGPMIIRSQSASDGAIASGNSVALLAMVALNQRASSFTLQNQIDKQILRYSSRLMQAPYDLSVMLTGIGEYQHPRPAYVQYAGAGHVKMSATLQVNNSSGSQLNVELKI
ncbi:MAG: thioredoxin domain-containing protein, partial [Gammaproteobacteria bacterium]|nr:thioredoxin domain-containing protein [Gammaproteobacteria bacterium]